MFRTFISSIAIATLITGALAFAGKTNVKETARKPASAEDTRAALAQKYMEIADTMAVARAAGETCEVEAYMGDIFSAVRKARGFDQTIKATPAVEAALGTSIGYRSIMGAIPKDGKNPDFFNGAKFFAPAMGVYGTQTILTLQAGGKLIVSTMNIDADPIKWETSSGSWSWVKERLVIIRKMGGKQFTRAYRLNWGAFEDATAEGALIPTHKKGEQPYPNYTPKYEDIRFYSMENGDCEA